MNDIAPSRAMSCRLWLIDLYRQIYWDMVQFFRYRLIVVSTMLTSVSMVLSFGFGTSHVQAMGQGGSSYFAFALPGIVGVGIMFSCTYTIGYAFIVDHNRRAMEDIVLSPLSYGGFLLGRLIGMMLKCSLQFIAVLLLASWMFGVHVGLPWRLLLGFVSACLFFGGFGIVVACFTNEVSFASVVNLVLIPLTYMCGVFFPLENFGSAQSLISWLPLSAQVDVLRSAISGAAATSFAHSAGLSLVYAVLMMGGALYVFKHRVTRR
ncbi:ABC transporter permease [Massilia mucilaginosa]|nr:ABC transporter permease [Massilia mucilaginosa]